MIPGQLARTNNKRKILVKLSVKEERQKVNIKVTPKTLKVLRNTDAHLTAGNSSS